MVETRSNQEKICYKQTQYEDSEKKEEIKGFVPKKSWVLVNWMLEKVDT